MFHLFETKTKKNRKVAPFYYTGDPNVFDRHKFQFQLSSGIIQSGVII